MSTSVLLIKGYDTRYQVRKDAEVYAIYTTKERAEAYRYLNKLKTGCMGNICKFWIEESQEG